MALMPITRVFEGSVDYLQILDKDGNVDKALEPKIDDTLLKAMYKGMVLARVWDHKYMALQRTGRMFTYPPIEGQEAIAVGATLACAKEDWLFPTYREASIVYYLRGHPASSSILIWMGLEEGLRLDNRIRCFPYATPIGTQLPHAVGAAYALESRGEKSATLVFCGDGATSEGDFHDAMNFAGVWNTPTVFIISNNQYAISVPRKWQTKSETLAQKALAYGFKGIQVDGNDILAVYRAVKDAAENARSGKGPVAIEFITYRMGPHTTADDPKRYRNEEEVGIWRDRDPIKRFQIYLKGKGIWDERFEKMVNDEAVKIVEDAVVKAEGYIPDPKDIFTFNYATMPKDLKKQMEECLGKSGGKDPGSERSR
jgi:pyruvate dehydrogenase E1 component alpha subunit